jgi:hypothetical protein
METNLFKVSDSDSPGNQNSATKKGQSEIEDCSMTEIFGINHFAAKPDITKVEGKITLDLTTISKNLNITNSGLSKSKYETLFETALVFKRQRSWAT